MKKMVSMLLVLAMLLSFAVVSVSAAPTNDLTANDFSLRLTEAEGTLTLELICSKEISAFGSGSGSMTVSAPDYFTLDSITTAVLKDFTDNTEGSNWGASAKDSKNGDDVAAGVWAAYTYTVNEIPAGDCTFTMTLGDDFNDISFVPYSCANAVLTATYHVGGSGETAAYTAGITAAPAEVEAGATVKATVSVSPAFNSSCVKVSYDADKLQYVSCTNAMVGGATANNGVLTIDDFGAEKTSYEITFTVLDGATAGDTVIKLEEASFDVDDNADEEELKPATITPASATVTIKDDEPEVFDVNLPDIFVGNDTATEGEDYTFTAADAEHYIYGQVTATMGGEAVTVTGSGTAEDPWTIQNVTGELEISGTRTAKQYVVTLAGNGAENATLPTANGGKFTYGQTDYVITMTPETGYTYKVEASNGTASISADFKTVTLTGVAADTTVTITKTAKTDNQVTVTGLTSSVNAPATYTTGTTFTFTVTREAGYKYTVKVNGTAAEPTSTSGLVDTYTVANPAAGGVTIDVTRELDGEVGVVKEYVKGDGVTFWMVTYKADKGHGYTYNGAVMYWSEKYEAYCVLATGDKPTPAKADFVYVTTAATEVDYSGNVNMSQKIDANDAQLIYNIYQTKAYADFATVNMEKFLRADVNGSGNLNVEDAQAVISIIKTARS